MTKDLLFKPNPIEQKRRVRVFREPKRKPLPQTENAVEKKVRKKIKKGVDKAKRIC